MALECSHIPRLRSPFVCYRFVQIQLQTTFAEKPYCMGKVPRCDRYAGFPEFLYNCKAGWVLLDKRIDCVCMENAEIGDVRLEVFTRVLRNL